MWVSVAIETDAAHAEALSDALMAAGAISASVEDALAGTELETPQFGEPGSPTTPLWEKSRVVALFEPAADLRERIAAALHEARLAVPADIAFAEVAEQDWVRLTQSQFEPIRVSDRLWIVPSWHVAPDPTAITLELDPGLAFGTGSHPTTRLCLRWLEQHLRGGECVLDYGCGSGILAIAAKKLGAGTVRGADLDEQAIAASRDNAQGNACAAEFFAPAALPAGTYDVLVANILTNPLKALMPLLAGRVRAGGRIALSGILVEQAEEILDLYGQAFDMALWDAEESWVCLSGVKR